MSLGGYSTGTLFEKQGSITKHTTTIVVVGFYCGVGSICGNLDFGKDATHGLLVGRAREHAFVAVLASAVASGPPSVPAPTRSHPRSEISVAALAAAPMAVAPTSVPPTPREPLVAVSTAAAAVESASLVVALVGGLRALRGLHVGVGLLRRRESIVSREAAWALLRASGRTSTEVLSQR